MLGLVVDAAHQRVFDADAALGRQEVIVGGVEHLSGVETLVHRHELVAKRITGRVQRHGQTHRDALGRELPDAGHDADGRYGDVTRGDAEPFGRHRADLAHGG